MPKYHINKHGEPARCDAQIKCRVSSGDGEHFEGNMREALDWAEKKNAQSAGGSFGSSDRKSYAKKTSKEPDYDSLYNVNIDSLKRSAEARRDLISNHPDADGDKFDNPDVFSDLIYGSVDASGGYNLDNDDYEVIEQEANAVYELAKEDGLSNRDAMKSAVTFAVQEGYEVNEAKRSESEKEQNVLNNNEKSQEFKNIDHSNPDTLRKVLASRFNNPDSPTRKLGHEEHYSRNAGKLNPTDLTGSGSEYTKKGENSLVILADENGKGVRAISSHSDYYEDPDNELGRSALQIKQYGMYNPDKKKLLVVVGYVSKDGEKTGYVPDKQVSMFVYK